MPGLNGQENEITDVIPLICSIFLANQGAGEAAEEGRQSNLVSAIAIVVLVSGF